MIVETTLLPTEISLGSPSGNLELRRIIEGVTLSPGLGLLSGTFPLNMTTQAGNLPSQANIRILYRPEQGADADGIVVATTTCNADGTWQVSGLDENSKFDIVARIPGFNDVIISNVQPTGAPLSAHFANLKEEYEFEEEVSIQVVALGGRPPYTFTAIELPEGLSINSNTGIISGVLTDKLGLTFQVKVTDTENEVIASGNSFIAGDPHWSNVAYLLRFNGSLINESALFPGFQASGGTGIYGSGVFGQSVRFESTQSLLESNQRLSLELGDTFTIELFTLCRTRSDQLERCLVSQWDYRSGGALCFILCAENNGDLIFATGPAWSSTSWIRTGPGVLPDNEWVHISVSVDSGYAKLFLNGQSVAEGQVNPVPSAATYLTLGTYPTGYTPSVLKGDIDELRITRGVARHTQNFIPPTKPFLNF